VSTRRAAGAVAFAACALGFLRPGSAAEAGPPAREQADVPLQAEEATGDANEPGLGPRIARGFAALERPTGIAEITFGWLTLPGAEVCSSGGCKEGDTSLEVGAWQIYRANLDFAFGAGLSFGLVPTTDVPLDDPPGISRDHTRSYLTVEGIVRFYPYVGENVEAWVGLTGGLVVVGDRFTIVNAYDDQVLVGPRGSTIRTEGGSIGAAAGVVLALGPSWTAGGTLRYGNWFLPSEPARNPFLDEASLTGINVMFSLGLNVAYRITL
jgi:hypothetical protein